MDGDLTNGSFDKSTESPPYEFDDCTFRTMDGDLTNGSFDNSTESPPYEFNDYTQRVIVAVMYLIVILLGTVGNILVILAVILSKKLRTTTNAFIVNLGVADLSLCLVLPWTVITTFSMNGLPIGEWVCSMAAVVQATAIGCSLYTLASIALQRLLLIKWPMTTHQVIYTPRKIVVWLAVAWCIPLLVTLIPPLADVGAVGYNKKYHHCGFPSTHPRSKDYDLIIVMGLYPIPLITIIICYVLIWKHLRFHAKMVTATESSSKLMTTHRNVVLELVSTMNSNHAKTSTSTQGTLRKSQLSRRQTKITKNMFYIICAFMLCLTPFVICLFCDYSDPFLPYASAILACNSCVNPLIYATKHHDFKTVFGCILRRKWENIPEPSDFLKTLIPVKIPCCGGGDVVT
ncbi:melatonin receptor type 1A-like [Patiria miniata]|uniref:G-protein coupled receptors family 1 profile domain-containing protein n=1 Tax=Patiria miniata TaxID=46514 RepID=A0A914BN19_PATMI|nr:melatonin receptor type 1A-like [Patiria miniata]